jgi:hypothetical protein
MARKLCIHYPGVICHLMKRLICVPLGFVFLPIALLNAAGAPPAEPPPAMLLASVPTRIQYYVSSAGADNQDGRTPKTAWRTIARVNRATLQPGNILNFEAGRTWTVADGLPLFIRQSGEAGHPICVRAFGKGAAPKFRCGDGDGITVLDSEWIELANLSVEGSGVSNTGVTTSQGAGINFKSTRRTTPNQKLDHIVVDGITVSGCKLGIFFQSVPVPPPATNWMGYRDVRITRCEVHHCGAAGIMTWGAVGAAEFPGLTPRIFHSGFYIADTSVHEMFGRNSIDGTYAGANAGTGIRLCNIENSLIERCVVRNVGHMGDDFQAVAGFESEASRNLVMQFSEACGVVSHNGHDGCGFDMFDGGTHDNVVQYCYSHDNDGGMAEGGGVPAFGGPELGASEGHVVRFNVSQNDHRRSRRGELTAGVIYFWGSMDRISVYNNTIYLSGGAEPMPRNAISIRAPVPRSFIANNVFVVGPGCDFVFADQPPGALPWFRGNVYWTLDRTPFRITAQEVAYESLDAWRAAGQETLLGAPVGMNVDPQFVAMGAGRDLLQAKRVTTLSVYDLRRASPLRGAAVNLVGTFGVMPGLVDFHGHLLDLSALAPGACQPTATSERVLSSGR